MKTYSLVVIILTFAISVSCWNLRVESICQAGDPTGTNHTLVNTKSFLGCTSACDFNPRCYYLSFYGTDCVMYEDESPCNGTNVGPTRHVYQVEPRCGPGWYRFSGSCYFVIPGPWIWAIFYYTECPNRGAHMVAIGSENEGTFLTELFHSLGMSDTMVWTGGSTLGINWTWSGSIEPMVYQNWKDGEPSSGYKLAINSTDAKWRSESSSVSMSGVCEKTLF